MMTPNPMEVLLTANSHRIPKNRQHQRSKKVFGTGSRLEPGYLAVKQKTADIGGFLFDLFLIDSYYSYRTLTKKDTHAPRFHPCLRHHA